MASKLELKRLLVKAATDPALAAKILMAAEGEDLPVPVANAEVAQARFAPLIGWEEQECLAVLALTRRYAVVDCEVLTRGNDVHTIVDPRQVLRWALTRDRPVSALIIGHNHPSGDPSPSGADLEVTQKLDAACKILGIALLDHLILARGRWKSMQEEGLLMFRTGEPR